eukprot:COSAG04_NODE_66_length_29513_cov_208.948732_4_plen_30_part_00
MDEKTSADMQTDNIGTATEADGPSLGPQR